jgi:hypothetical protein
MATKGEAGAGFHRVQRCSQRRPRNKGLRGVVGAAGSAVFVATGRIVAEYPERQFW